MDLHQLAGEVIAAAPSPLRKHLRYCASQIHRPCPSLPRQAS